MARVPTYALDRGASAQLQPRSRRVSAPPLCRCANLAAQISCFRTPEPPPALPNREALTLHCRELHRIPQRVPRRRPVQVSRPDGLPSGCFLHRPCAAARDCEPHAQGARDRDGRPQRCLHGADSAGAHPAQFKPELAKQVKHNAKRYIDMFAAAVEEINVLPSAGIDVCL